MNILIIGSMGLLGRHVTELLLREKFNVICAGRNIGLIKDNFPQADFFYCNLLKDTSINDWLPRLTHIDVIINCAEVLYHRNHKILWKILLNAPQAVLSRKLEKT